jgi:hypothetical protein
MRHPVMYEPVDVKFHKDAPQSARHN